MSEEKLITRQVRCIRCLEAVKSLCLQINSQAQIKKNLPAPDRVEGLEVCYPRINLFIASQFQVLNRLITLIE